MNDTRGPVALPNVTVRSIPTTELRADRNSSKAFVALRNGLNANLVRRWVVLHKAQALAAPGDTTKLLPVVVKKAGSQPVACQRVEPSIEQARPDRTVLRDLIEALRSR